MPNARKLHYENYAADTCYDWVIAPSTYHYSCSKYWYNCNPYTEISPPYKLPSGQIVEGFGDVEIPTLSLKGPGRPQIARLRLRNVLHIPKARCNVLSASLSERELGATRTDMGCYRGRAQKDKLWYTEDFHGVQRLRLSDKQPGLGACFIVEDHMRFGKFIPTQIVLNTAQIEDVKDVLNDARRAANPPSTVDGEWICGKNNQSRLGGINVEAAEADDYTKILERMKLEE